jgi:hypothetical protein
MLRRPLDPSRSIGILEQSPGDDGVFETVSSLSRQPAELFQDPPAALAAVRGNRLALLIVTWDGEENEVYAVLAEAARDTLFRRSGTRLFVLTRRISVVGEAKRLGADLVIRRPFPHAIFAEALARLGQKVPA